MDSKDFIPWFFGLWFITFPLTIFITYTVVTELLDIIFNTGNINRLLKHSDNLNSDPLEKQYTLDKGRQTNLDQSNLMELERQIKYIRQVKNKNSWTNRTSFEEKEKITAAKEISDVFKIK
ncbi:MAG: hypothetical protein EPN37_06395 [Chitinophagaceae bacterium]|nr:MAG: hypothetical protein EPN37_06395 [Chitinophagaceae bacterium]